MSAGQRLAPALAHGVRAPGAQHPGRHVVDGDEGGRRWVVCRHFLEHQRGVEARQGETTNRFGRVQAAETQLAGFGDGGFGEDGLRVPLGGVGREFGHREIARRLRKGALVFVEFKVHRRFSCCVLLLFLIAASAYGISARALSGSKLNHAQTSSAAYQFGAAKYQRTPRKDRPAALASPPFPRSKRKGGAA